MPPARKKGPELGKSLQRRKKVDMYTSTRHSADLEQHQAITSVTETTSIDEFLTNAEAAQRNFEAERGYAAIKDLGVVPEDQEIDPNQDPDGEDIEETEAEFCSIPKKPLYDSDDTAETFQEKEIQSFLKWKRSLARLQARNPKLPPFERNLEFWRQLWKIIELSDVIVQVVDARDPLFYQSSDLAQYVKEMDSRKESVLLLNKADLLSQEQRVIWSKYFLESDTKVLFFSATLEEFEGIDEHVDDVEFGSSTILRPDQVLQVMKNLMPKQTVTVGFTGYPNVGKSSTINRFLTSKKLQVSATPGKTKHFQTHIIGGSCVFIDGPGLVIPNLNMDRASMVLGGILPIDTLSEYGPAMDLLCAKIPFEHLLNHYGIMKSAVLKAKKTDRKMSQAMLFLSSLGFMRGLVKAGGQPDHSRAARIVLKNFVEGKLVFCQGPPDVDQTTFCKFNLTYDNEIHAEDDLDLEESFPELKVSSGVHMRGKRLIEINGRQVEVANKKHGNKKKREKLRRVFNDNPYA